MTHLSEDDLVLHYYGERETGGPQGHLETCEACRANFAALAQVLDAMSGLEAPEPAEDLGSRVWQRIRPQLAGTRTPWWSGVARWFEPRNLAVAGAMAVLVIAAFLAGRISQRSTKIAGLSGPVRERIMLVAVGDHLEQSQMVLVELVNNESTGTVDISAAQHRAEDLIGENRLYRQAALKSGDRAVSSVLDELERVLLDIAHSPSKLDSEELDQIRQRIEADGILFKIRVVGTNLKKRERVAPAGKAL
ncbi:MAG TPA: hypothetical protein VJN43_01060 [Bryobacteraceae bacterium]|nr:hypothetical protein [Bryobacteraceae bacterium]